MYVKPYVLTRSDFCHGNATIWSLFIVVGVDVAVNIQMFSMLPWECNNEFPLHPCQTTKYFVLLLITISIKYYECLSVFLS
jgi:hypothetical protein